MQQQRSIAVADKKAPRQDRRWGSGVAKIAQWALPDELTSTDPTPAAELLTEYFTTVKKDGSPVKSGAKFETFAGGGDRQEVADRITAEDILAVSLLSVHVPGDAVLKLLGSEAEQLSSHLSVISVDLDLRDAVVGDIETGSPADNLWTAVRGAGVGPVTTSKLLARKRPRLLPVRDSVVVEVLRHPRSASFWFTLRECLNADGGRLHEHLLSVRDAAGIGDRVSVIRCFDVVVWMIGKRDGLGQTRGRP
jgi:hypothetical protein